MIGFAAIAPHGDVEETPELLAAMRELGRRFDASGCETAVVITPHNVHVEGHFAVVVAGRVGEHQTDVELARELVDAMRRRGLPVVGVSYGGNDAAGAEMPLDWGSEIPLAYLQPRRVLVVAPARDRPLDEHVDLGRILDGLSANVALIASADHGHAHQADGPYGYHPDAKRYDDRFLELLGRHPLDFRPLAELVEDGKADSLWQLLVLQGATAGRAELLAYARPSYYGMAVAVVG